MVLAYGGGITNFAPAFGLSFYPLGNFTLIIYTIIVTYSTLRHRLLDLDVFITRTGIFVSVYSLVLGLPFALAFGLKEQLIKLAGYDIWWVFPLSAMAVCATAGPFLYLFIQKKAEERLLQEQNRYQSTLRQASAGMGKIKDLDRLVSLIVHIVSRAVRLEHCMIYLRDAGQKNFRLAACRSRAPRFNPTESIPADSVLVSRIVQTRGPIVWEEIRLQTEEAGDLKLARLEAELRGLNAALVVPSFDNEKLLAVMVLGKKISGRLYSDSDLAVFSILANQAALAIENALFYAQMRRTHEQLFKAEKMATIGTMAEGLSHQINNRLHALGFIAGDALDALQSKSGLAASPEIRQLLADLEDALRRIEDNVDRGGDVVRGLLKYSRKEDEGFSAVDLDQLITAVVEMIRFKVRPDELTILREYGDSLPKIRGSFAQLQEVFFNLIDNAYDAVSQRRQELKEPGYEPAIRIAASGDNNGGINITVRDNGSGIKDEDQDKLFTPFFTTKVSSRQGTGLGLYVIQRLIEENHGGRVRFTSRYGEGTTVSIYLPAAKRDTNSQ